MLHFMECLYNMAIHNSVGNVMVGKASTLVTQAPVNASGPCVKSDITKVFNFIGTIPFKELVRENYIFVRLAGLTGLTAVIMNYCATKRLEAWKFDEDAKDTFEMANNVHFAHALALFLVPFVENPVFTGSLLTAGTVIFSGALYLRAFTGNECFLPFAPIGLNVLAVAWVSFFQ